ncbi:MAG: hypothetical protein V1767_03550 [Chloroflexota bacterium]
MSKNPVKDVGEKVGEIIMNPLTLVLAGYAAWIGYSYFKNKQFTLTPWKPIALPIPAELLNIGRTPVVEQRDRESCVSVDLTGPIPSGSRGYEERVAVILP